MNTSLSSRPELEVTLLCRFYVCVVLDVSALRVRSEGFVQCELLPYAVGFPSSGSPHFLGSWRGLDRMSMAHPVAHDLKARGVERLQYVLVSDPAEMEAAFWALYGDVRVLPAVGIALSPGVIDSIPSGHRRHLVRAHEVGIQLGQRLRRAVAAHSVFSSSDAAQAFIDRTAERYLDGGLPKPVARPTRGALGRGSAATAVVR